MSIVLNKKQKLDAKQEEKYQPADGDDEEKENDDDEENAKVDIGNESEEIINHGLGPLRFDQDLTAAEEDSHDKAASCEDRPTQADSGPPIVFFSSIPLSSFVSQFFVFFCIFFFPSSLNFSLFLVLLFCITTPFL